MDREEKLVFAIIAAMVIAAVLGIHAVVKENENRRIAFMAECEKDRKHYECVAMWRAGGGFDSLPVPVIIPGR